MPANRKLTYQIGINADTSQARASINDIVRDLQRLGSQPVLGESLQQASAAALDLSRNLQSSIGSDGKLNLTAFNDNLQKSSLTLSDYYNQLKLLGVQGQQTFLNLSQAIMSAETPLIRTNKLMSNLWITMKNTVRWQITSSALQGFIGALETAYRYTQDLNESLTNIRIVTNGSAEDMANFAKQANDAAKALSTTTVDYTDAALIYYQQGLSEQEVIDRTETTIKMANAAGTSAETASEQLTAIWNNFYDGSKSLEYYADVMVRLGADTASSSDEISEGIQQFAAVADTVGLSYEYAASALATVTATTRESANIVGTAFRTIFARIQGLNLGETLDDGTTLNKYSQALESVGISIFDVNGEIRSMDSLLDELGSKWETLSNDQQIALAQTLAGVRQYTRLIALMDEWDFFQENLARAYAAEGSLQKQAEIYAESWEAARDRVTAAAEDVYDSIINPDLFISIDNILTPFLGGVADVVDGLGGLRGILSVTGILMNRVFGDKIAQSMRDMAANLGIIGDRESERAQMLRAQAAEIAKIISQYNAMSNNDSIEYQMVEAQAKIVQLQGEASAHAQQLSERQASILQQDIERVKSLQQQADLLGRQVAEARELQITYESSLFDKLNPDADWLEELDKIDRDTFSLYDDVENILYSDEITNSQEALQALLGILKKSSAEFAKFEQVQKLVKAETNGVSQETIDLVRSLQLFEGAQNATNDEIREYLSQQGQFTNDTTEVQNAVLGLQRIIESLGDGSGRFVNDLQRLIVAYKRGELGADAFSSALNRLEKEANETSNAMKNNRYAVTDWADTLVKLGTSLSQVSMGITAVNSVFDTVGESFKTGEFALEDFIGILTNLGMLLPTISTLFKKGVVQNGATALSYLVMGESAKTAALGITTAGTAISTAIPLIGLITVGITILIKVISAFIVTEEEAREKISAATQAYEDQKSALESLNSELQSTKDRIEELNNQDTLTIVEQEELDKLLLQEASLERQVELVEQLAKARQASQARTIEENFENSTQTLAQGPDLNRQVTYRVNVAEDEKWYQDTLAGIDWENLNQVDQALMRNTIENEYQARLARQLQSDYLDIETWFDIVTEGLDENSTAYQDYLVQYDKWVKENEEITAEWVAEQADAIQEAENNYLAYVQAIVDGAIDYDEATVTNMQEILANIRKNVYGSEAEYQQAIFEPLLDNSAISQSADQIYSVLSQNDVDAAVGLISEAIEKELMLAGVSVDEFLAYIDNKVDTTREKVSSISGVTEDQLNQLTAEDWEILAILNLENIETADELWDALEKYKESNISITISGLEYVQSLIDSSNEIQDIMSSIVEGEELTEDQIGILQRLEKEYTQLGEIRDRSSNNYIQALRDIREGYEFDAIKAAKQDLQDYIDEAERLGTLIRENGQLKISAEVDTEEYSNFVDNIMNADYAITIAIKADIESDINDLADRADAIMSAAEAIGESYRVAYEDIMNVAQAFPGILEGYQVLADGTIQLNQQVAQEAIKAANSELQAEQNTVIGKMQAQVEYNTRKAEALRTMAALMDEMNKAEINGEEITADQKEAVNKAWLEFVNISNEQEADSNARVAEAEIEDANQVAAAIDDQYSQSADNVAKAYDSMLRNSAEWARNSIYYISQVGKALQQLSNGQTVTATIAGTGRISSHYSGTHTESIYSGTYESKDIEENNWKDFYDQGNYQSASDLLNQQADYFESVAQGWQAGIAYIESLGQTAQYTASKVPNVSGDTGSSSEDTAGTVYDAEDEKTLKDIEDRYHEINREIEDQSSLLEDIGNRIDRTYGTKRLEEYQKELEALEDQQENYNQKLAEAQAYLEQDKTNLQNLFGGTITFKENGEIVNYQQVLQSIIDDYNNSFLKDYNAFLAEFSALTKEEQEARQAEYDSWQIQKTIAEELYQARLDALSQYEDTLDVIQEINDSIEDTAREIADNRLNQIEHRLEVVITVKDMRDAVRDLTKDIVESFGDMLTHGIEAAELSWEQAQADMGMLSEYQTTLKQYQDELANATDATDIDRIIGNLEDLQGQAISTAEALLSWIESLETLLPDALADASDRFAQFTDQLEHNESVLGLIEELYALQGVTYKTQEGFEQLQRVGQETLEAQVGQAQLQRVWYENSKQALIEAEKALAGVSEDDAAYDTLKNNRDALLAEYNEAQEAMLQAAQAAMETAQEMYTQAIEKAVYDFGQAISGGTGLDLLQDKFDHYIDTEGRYLDKVNEAYEVASWYNKLQTDIDKATNSKMKEQLKALQEEIDIRRENNTLSEYDLKILEAKYNVLQAQMALEDAQNAKNQMRLVRDRQGNWNYQYTADPTQIADAQQDLLDAENEWYNIAKQQVEDVTGEIISTWQECQEAIKAIYSDMTLTDEERSAKAQEIYSYYTQKIKDLESEKQNAIKDMTEAGNESLFDLAIIAGDEVSDITGITSDEIQNIIKESGMSIIDLLNSDSETIKDIFGDNVELIDMFDNTFAKDLANMTNNANNFEDMLSKALDEANKAFEEYNDTVAGVANDTGTSLDDLAGYIDEVSDSTDICTDAGLEAADAMWEQLDAIQELSVYYSELADSVYEYIEALRDLAQETVDTVDDEVNRGEGGSSSDEEDNEPSRPSSGGSGSSSSGGGGDTGGGNGIPEIGDEVIYNGGTYYHDSYGDNPAGRRGPGKKVQITNIVKGRPYPIHVYSTDSAYGWLKESQISGFDTGGYTGEFNNAKLAFLHEKELVLNQEDTEKILSAVRAVRGLSTDFISSIEKALDGNAMSAVGAMIARLGGNPQVAPANGTIEQRVTIERVEFPNVTSSDEITEAFRSLVDDAAQWANRRKG